MKSCSLAEAVSRLAVLQLRIARKVVTGCLLITQVSRMNGGMCSQVKGRSALVISIKTHMHGAFYIRSHSRIAR